MKFLQIVGGLLAAFGITVACTAQAESPNLERFFTAKNTQGTFALFDPQKNIWLYHNEARAGVQYLPASTFKIPNSLIALEARIADTPDFELVWDKAKYPRQPWWPEAWATKHSLHTALQYSVVWYYQEIARRVGRERMQSYVDQFGYGNRTISGGIDRFWLTGDLRISAKEQVGFLERFYAGNLGMSEATTQAVKKMLILEETPEYRLSGKTGWVGFGEVDQQQLGWLVGYLERGKDVYFYALNIDLEKSEDAAKRMAITKEIFKSMSLL